MAALLVIQLRTSGCPFQHLRFFLRLGVAEAFAELAAVLLLPGSLAATGRLWSVPAFSWLHLQLSPHLHLPLSKKAHSLRLDVVLHWQLGAQHKLPAESATRFLRLLLEPWVEHIA